MMESLYGYSLWDNENRWLWIAATVAFAYLIQQIYYRYGYRYGKRERELYAPQTAYEQEVDNSTSTRESRLLRKQFGVISISDDLVLQSEQDDTKTNDCLTTKEEEEEERVYRSTAEDPQSESTPGDDPNSETETKEDESEHEAQAQAQAQAQLAGEEKDNPKKPKKTRKEKIRERLAAAADARLRAQPPPFLHPNDIHPGLAAFWHWCDVETSLFRIYTVTRKDGVHDETTVAPYNPSSRRGTVNITLRVTNDLDVPIAVYWINYSGAHVEKGNIAPNGGTWRQTTWIDHPWIFCATTDGTGQERILLHYIPYRVIPTTAEAPTIDNYDEAGSGKSGVHQFRIAPSAADSLYSCDVDDPILPHPAEAYLTSPRAAAEFALLHCLRMNYGGWNVLQKYLNMILQDPDNPQYRQIRTSNRTFAEAVWNTPARGILLAAGFVEHGAYAELGSDTALSHATVQELSLLLFVVGRWKERSEGPEVQLQQPEGADGYGRAGFGQ